MISLNGNDDDNTSGILHTVKDNLIADLSKQLTELKLFNYNRGVKIEQLSSENEQLKSRLKQIEEKTRNPYDCLAWQINKIARGE